MVADEITAKTPAAEMRPEIELLLCCARTYIDFETAKRIKILLKKDIDWDYLIQTALWHGVIPLLYSSLNTTCPEAVPTTRLTQLRNYFYTNVRRNLFLTGQLIKVLNLFEANGIPAIPYKGPVLAAVAYGNLALRQFCDLDILIHERDILSTKNLLISEGYQLQLQLNWEYHFVHKDSRLNLDIHWGITQRERPFPLDFERLWSRLEPLSLAGKKVLSLQPEDLLLILCVQVTKDCWQWKELVVKLAKICDIAELIRVYPVMDWNSIVEQAGKLGSERILFFSLLLARDLLGTPLPEEILQRKQAHPVVEALALQVRERLFCADYKFGVADRPPKFLEIEKNLFYFRVRERLRDRVPYFLHLVHVAIAPSVEDRTFLPLPPSGSFLYYLIRPIRVIGKYGLRPLKRLLRF
jgi:hypothetical protein